MQSQDRDKVAYYAALAIFFGSLELFLPKIVPFFRLGIANIPIVLALSLPIKPFLLLTLLKGIGNSYVSGNLFSVFAIVSITQSILSGLAMYALKRLFNEHISSYGLSMSGAIVSTFVQIFLISLYIGKAVLALLPLMLALSLLSSILVAFISYKIELPDSPPKLTIDENTATGYYIPIATLIISGCAVMMSDNVFIALLSFLLALSFQYITGRKIKLAPHLIIMAVMLFSSLLTPIGRVLFSIGSFSITAGALELGVEKALRLSAGIALSQGYSELIRPRNGMIGKTLGYFTALLSSFKEEKGSFVERARHTLELKDLNARNRGRKETKPYIMVLYSIALVLLTAISRIL